LTCEYRAHETYTRNVLIGDVVVIVFILGRLGGGYSAGAARLSEGLAILQRAEKGLFVQGGWAGYPRCMRSCVAMKREGEERTQQVLQENRGKVVEKREGEGDGG
jgi:hypothetical protein